MASQSSKTAGQNVFRNATDEQFVIPAKAGIQERLAPLARYGFLLAQECWENVYNRRGNALEPILRHAGEEKEKTSRLFLIVHYNRINHVLIFGWDV